MVVMLDSTRVEGGTCKRGRNAKASGVVELAGFWKVRGHDELMRTSTKVAAAESRQRCSMLAARRSTVVPLMTASSTVKRPAPQQRLELKERSSEAWGLVRPGSSAS